MLWSQYTALCTQSVILKHNILYYRTLTIIKRLLELVTVVHSKVNFVQKQSISNLHNQNYPKLNPDRAVDSKGLIQSTTSYTSKYYQKPIRTMTN